MYFAQFMLNRHSWSMHIEDGQTSSRLFLLSVKTRKKYVGLTAHTRQAWHIG
jgi:hypothetical protein